jgi:ABC-type uncharacterized transport system substrate-binding protein
MEQIRFPGRLHLAAVHDIVSPKPAGLPLVGPMTLRNICLVLAALASLVLAVAPASAHPHVWVTVKSEILYAPDGTITGVRHAWTFDDMFSIFATQGLEAKKKGEFTREELAPLAKVNVESLKEYDFFTNARLDGKKIEFNEPSSGYYLVFDPKETVLTLHFELPLKAPAKGKDLSIEVFDREFFVDFSLAEKDPAKLVGAPEQCKLTIGKPAEMGAALSQQLSQLGPDQRNSGIAIGDEFANKIAVKCP